MNKLISIVIGFCLFANASLVHAQQKQQPRALLVEEFSFSLKDFKVDHQGENNNLNISIWYRYTANITKSEYPDFRWLAKDVETLLTSYPNEDDYWEIVNKQVTALLLRKYPALVSVTCQLDVSPSGQVPYSRSSRVTRERPVTRASRKRSSSMRMSSLSLRISRDSSLLWSEKYLTETCSDSRLELRHSDPIHRAAGAAAFYIANTDPHLIETAGNERAKPVYQPLRFGCRV